MTDGVRRAARAAARPLAGLVITYALLVLTPWGRTFDSLSYHGRWGAGWKVRMADLALLETISTVTVLSVLVVLIVVAGWRGRWRLGLAAATVVLGSIATAEALKYVLPSRSEWSGQWRWLSIGSFPSGHAVTITSIALAVLLVSSGRWRKILVGPLVAWTAVATSATVTVGWHRPSDVIGSLFLATAWHRACTASQPEERRLRAMLPRPSWLPAVPRPALAGLLARPLTWPDRPTWVAVGWWALACLLVLGAAAEGALAGRTAGRVPTLAYLMSLSVMLAGAGLTIAATAARPAAVTARRPPI